MVEIASASIQLVGSLEKVAKLEPDLNAAVGTLIAEEVAINKVPAEELRTVDIDHSQCQRCMLVRTGESFNRVGFTEVRPAPARLRGFGGAGVLGCSRGHWQCSAGAPPFSSSDPSPAPPVPAVARRPLP